MVQRYAETESKENELVGFSWPEADRRILDIVKIMQKPDMRCSHIALSAVLKYRSVMNNNTDMTVNEAVVQKMEELRKAGRVNSWYRYRSMLHALESYGGAGIPFERLTPLWLSGCESAWRSSGRNSTTISIYMKSLRCIFHLHHGGPGPFASYRIPRPSMRRMALPSSGIRSILQWRGSDGPRDGEIEFVRSKTRFSAGGTVVRAHLSPVMREIIARRGTGEGRVAGNRYIFRYLHGDETPFQLETTVRRVIRRCNSDMRKLAEELHIPPFTTYTARHTFATVLQRKGVSVSYISECLGHCSVRTTEAYLAGFEPEDREKYSGYLTDF